VSSYVPGFQQALDEPELQAEFFDLIHMLHLAFLLFLGCKGVWQVAAVPYLKVCPPTVAEFSVKWLHYAISVFLTLVFVMHFPTLILKMT